METSLSPKNLDKATPIEAHSCKSTQKHTANKSHTNRTQITHKNHTHITHTSHTSHRSTPKSTPKAHKTKHVHAHTHARAKRKEHKATKHTKHTNHIKHTKHILKAHKAQTYSPENVAVLPTHYWQRGDLGDTHNIQITNHRVADVKLQSFFWVAQITNHNPFFAIGAGSIRIFFENSLKL